MIDWTQPLFVDCEPVRLDHNGESFKSVIFEVDPDRKRWYYNLDGTPFGKNPYGHVSNFEVDIPPDEFHLAWLAEQDARQDTLEAIPGYATF